MTTDDHIRFMRLALHEASLALDRDEIPVGCVIVSDGQVIGRGYNLTQTLHDVTAHAEMQAITAAASTLGGKYLTNATLYVTLEPCVMCAGAIGLAQLTAIVYGADDPKRGFRSLAPNALHPKCSVISGILADQCREMLQQFFQQKRL